MPEITEDKKDALDTLFQENEADVNKNQAYKDHFKEFELPEKYYIMEMYNKQKELQSFLAAKGKTKTFPDKINQVRQDNVATAIYHLFCMQIEHQELNAEIEKIHQFKSENPEQELPEHLVISARYELIDMFFFMFNVGIYSGLDINDVIEELGSIIDEGNSSLVDSLSTYNIEYAIQHLLNYIDKLPWKAWKEYDYNEFYKIPPFKYKEIVNAYANALHECIIWGKAAFNETTKSLFDLYMNKWEENKRRQEDLTSGYVLAKKEIIDEIEK